MSTSETTVATQQEIIVTGFGGQGIILAGRIIGMAASLGDNKESTLTQAYGPSPVAAPATPRPSSPTAPFTIRT